MTPFGTYLVPKGILLPASVLSSTWFSLLAAFVALNTIVYVALAVLKSLPKASLSRWSPRRYIRGETRNIHPDAPR